MKAILSIILSICTIAGFGQAMAQATDFKTIPAGEHAAVVLKVQSSPGHYTFSQVSGKVIPGALETSPTAAAEANDFQIVVLDHLKIPVDTIIIRKPFQALKSATNEDDKKHRVVGPGSHQSMVRFNYTSNMKYLMVNLVGKNGETKTVSFLPLTITQ